MRLDTCHFEIHVHSEGEAERFYVEALGLTVLQRLPAAKLLAVQAGGVRISIFYDREIDEVRSAGGAGGHVIFRTPSLIDTLSTLSAVGIVTSAVSEAPGFMKFVSLTDPSGNRVEIAEYLRDPLVAI